MSTCLAKSKITMYIADTKKRKEKEKCRTTKEEKSKQYMQ